MILVTGANGHFGSATIDYLLQKGVQPQEIAALVRSEEKGASLKDKGIELRLGDYHNYNSLMEGFKGIDKLLFVSSPSPADRTQEHTNVVNAAKKAGVKHIVYTSLERKNETANSPLKTLMLAHVATEKAIKGSGIDYTIMRCNLYGDYIPWMVGEKVLETGIYYPAGSTKVNWTMRNDMAEAAANILIGEGHRNKDYYISSAEQFSFLDIANIISEVSGKQVSYTSPGVQEYTTTASNAGMPQMLVEIFAGFATATEQGEFLTEKMDLEKLLGRKPLSIKGFLKNTYSN